MQMMVGVGDVDSAAREAALSARERLSRGPRERASAPAAPPSHRPQPQGAAVDWVVVEESLQQDLADLVERLRSEGESGEEFDPALLDAFRHCFQRLVEQFRSYRPLMSVLKEAFDRVLEGYRDTAAMQRTRVMMRQSAIAEAEGMLSQIESQAQRDEQALQKVLDAARRRQHRAEARRFVALSKVAAAREKLLATKRQTQDLEQAKEALHGTQKRTTDELEKHYQFQEKEFGETWKKKDERDKVLKKRDTAKTGLADDERTAHSSKERRRPLFWQPFSAVTEPAPGLLVPLSGFLASRRRKQRKNGEKTSKNGRDMA